MAFTRMLAGSLAVALFLLDACSSENPLGPASIRVAVPPVLAPAFSSLAGNERGSFQFVEMHPYTRARDLEVLLFASDSLAFQGVVIPGRSVPLLHPWLGRMSVKLPGDIREDIARTVEASSPLAFPLTTDFGVLVTRADLWRSLPLPPPSSLAGLREALLVLRSREATARSAILTDLPMDELFWDLSWSFEGRADSALYTFPKVHVLEFIREFRLDRRLSSEDEVLEELQAGRSAAVFTSLQHGLRFCAADSRLTIQALPAGRGKALALYSGWCLAKLSADADVERRMARFMQPTVQRHLARSGWVSVLRTVPVAPPGRAAWESTELHVAPDLGAAGDEIVLGALLDATQGPMTAEEALRRGAARLRAQRGS
jgi:hypothetical protein